MPGQNPDHLEQLLGVPERLAELIARYYDADLPEQEADELRTGLTQSAAARDWFVRLGLQSQSLAEALAPQYSEADDTVSIEQLAEAEAKAEPDFSLLQNPAFEASSAKADQPKIAAHELWSLASYYTAKGLRTKAGVIGSVAAVLLLGLVLFVVIAGTGPDSPEPPETANNNNPLPETDPEPPAPRVVAKLIDEQDATWDRRPGVDFYAGQRFRLFDGIAVVMTNRGAVAAIEAPATIEFLHDDNSLYLHEGRLVGRCESASSKGFVVRTDCGDIIDLGTVFGVEAGPDRMLATVFEGEIEVAAPASPVINLNTGQTARVSITGDVVQATVEDQLASGFESLHQVERTPAERWQAYAEELSRDDDLLAYYSFDEGTIVDGRAINQAVQARNRLDATLGRDAESARPAVISGRFEGAEALYFDRSQNLSTAHDQVLVVPDWAEAARDLRALTLAAWVRLDDTTGWHLIATQWSDIADPDDRFGFHFGVRCADYTILDEGQHNGGADVVESIGVPGPSAQLHLSADGARYRYDFNNAWRTRQAPLEEGRWYLLACTIDARAGVSSLYIDGRQVDSNRMRFAEGVLPSLTSPLMIGGKTTVHEDVGMHGAIDDIVFLSRVLSGDEIRAMYEAGVPE